MLSCIISLLLYLETCFNSPAAGRSSMLRSLLSLVKAIEAFSRKCLIPKLLQSNGIAADTALGEESSWLSCARVPLGCVINTLFADKIEVRGSDMAWARKYMTVMVLGGTLQNSNAELSMQRRMTNQVQK